MQPARIAGRTFRPVRPAGSVYSTVTEDFSRSSSYA